MEIEVPSIKTSIFQRKNTPENGKIVGYGAITEKLKLSIPSPNTLSLITEKSKKYNTKFWQVKIYSS
jgi:hypothetical protein